MITPEELVRREVLYCVSQLMYQLREVIEQTEYADEYNQLMFGTNYDEAVEAWIDDLDASGLYDVAENVSCCSDLLEELDLRPDIDKLASYAEDNDVFEHNEDNEWFWHDVAYESLHTLLIDNADAEKYALRDWIASADALDYLDSDKLQRLRNKIYEEIDDYAQFCHENDIDTSDYEYEAYEHWIVSNWLAHELKERGHIVCMDFMGLTIWGRACTGQCIAMDGVIKDICNELNNN